MLVLRPILIVLILLFLPSQSLIAERWALLIGINEYIYEGIPDLKGCENDVNLMYQVLTTKYGFTRDNIGVLLSGSATKANMVVAFREWLIEKPNPDDTVILYYSGHGVQTVDMSGDEDDGFDEALCPTDVKPNTAQTEFVNVLLDDELEDLLGQIPTDNVTIILDCCHSGTATKSLVPVGMCSSRVINRDLVLAPNPNRIPLREQPRTGSRKDVAEMNHVVITGCDDHEVSQERTWYTPDVGYFRCGVLTKNLVEELERSQTGVTYATLMDRVRKSIGAGAVQTPQIHGDIDRPIFSMRDVGGNIANNLFSAKPYVLITNTVQDLLTLNAGSLHGVTRGSVYAVYSPMEIDFSGSPLAQVQVIDVQLNSANARISDDRAFVIEKRTSLIPSMARAIEVQHAFPKDNLYVRIDSNPSHATGFVQHLGVENFIAVADEERADFLLQIASSFGSLRGTLVGADGRIVFQKHVESVDKLAIALRRIIEREVLIKLLSAFRNPNPSFDLKVWVDKGDNPVYQVGEAMEMSFRAGKDCYLVLLDIDSEGYVTMMYPNKYHPQNKISGGRTYTIPSDDMRFKIRAQEPTGRELIIALATTIPLSSPIFQIQNQSEILVDLTGAKLGTELLRIVRRSLLGEKGGDSTHVSLPTSGWVSDSLLIVLVP